MIVVTGAAGFIGSCLISRLNASNFNAIVAVDKFGDPEKELNLKHKVVKERVPRDTFMLWLGQNWEEVEFIFHIGARTNTAEFDRTLLRKLNTDYSKGIWERCIEYQIPLIYASSAATYGLGELGYDDDPQMIPRLVPLNPYGDSKNDFDKWALIQEKSPFFWAGLKFFNVYGPNEYHKRRMASVVLHSFNQISQTGKMRLFRSHNPDFEDGEQKRDFIYVKDVVDVCYFLMHHRKESGIYNLGTGKAPTFLDLARSVFRALNQAENIEFIDTPADIRDTYQYYTKAKMDRLRNIGFASTFTSLEDGVDEYVRDYLINRTYY